MKRTLAVLILALVAVGGAGVAYAHGGDRPARRAAARECLREARQANEGADKATIREAVKACLQEQGIELGGNLTPEQREQAKACISEAREAGGERSEIRAAARSCMEAAGIVPPLTPEQQERRAKLRSCVEQARAGHGDDRSAVHQAVRECMRA